MLLRALVLVQADPLYDRVSGVVAETGVHVTRCGATDRMWTELERGGFDLLIADSMDLPTPWDAVISALRDLPDRTELIALVGSEEGDEGAPLQAAGAFAVLNLQGGEQDLRAGLAAVLRRFRELAVSRLRSLQEEETRASDPASQSPAMQRLLRLAHRVAAADTTLLLLGETGVGKEWLARAIHADGPRARSEFVPINCAAVPESLLESELFGHEAGAFTGAARARRGAFELAHRGTLLLDEIGDLPLHLQSKLLRALQERKIQRLGAEKPVEVDVRVIAATHRDLQSAMSEGSFRPDLYYRLSVVTLNIPPLRERREDIRLLAAGYLEYFRTRLGRPRLVGFSDRALEALERHAWPGNVRELVNTVERAVLLSETETIEAHDLFENVPVRSPSETRAPAETAVGEGSGERLAATYASGEVVPLRVARQAVVEAFERSYLDRLLRQNRGHLGDTARAAGIDDRTLYNKMRRLSLSREEYRGHGSRTEARLPPRE